MVALESALEGRAGARGAYRLGLVDGAVVVHQDIVLFMVLLAPPDPPGDQRQPAENYGAADADDYANHRVPRLR